jgi:hypothetical protein
MRFQIRIPAFSARLEGPLSVAFLVEIVWLVLEEDLVDPFNRTNMLLHVLAFDVTLLTFGR